jgi:hypothetical protein
MGRMVGRYGNPKKKALVLDIKRALGYVGIYALHLVHPNLIFDS